MNIDFVKNRLLEHIQNIIMIASTVLCIIFTLVLCIHGYKLFNHMPPIIWWYANSYELPLPRYPCRWRDNDCILHRISGNIAYKTHQLIVS